MNIETQQLTLRKGISVTGKVVLKTKPTIIEYWRDRNINIYIWSTFSHIAETRNVPETWDLRGRVASSSWTKHGHLGKCSNEKLRTSTLFNDGTVRSTVGFASALSNANNVKISDLLEFLVMLFGSSLRSHPKSICRKLQYYENIHGGDYILIIFGRSFFPFLPASFQKHTWMATFLWSYLL